MKAGKSKLNGYIEKIISLNTHKQNETGTVPTYFIRTYGCQMNDRDSEKLTALIETLGYTAATSQDVADLVLYNTCCVRESAEDKVFGHLGDLNHLKKTRKDMIVAICGCMTQQEHIAQQFAQKHNYINIIFGTGNRHRFPEFLYKTLTTGKNIMDITEDDGLPELDNISVTTREFPHKAGVNIMFGCDNYCSYCIVPYVRGREKSRLPQDIIKEVQELVNDGVVEIMLLGQNVNSYGQNLEVPTSFPKLLYEVNKINGLKRIRFMTSHPKDVSDELLFALRDLDKVCKSLHLPLQSGSTKVLHDMNRKYTQEDYLSLIRRAKEHIPEIGLSTDIIVGYPGETDEDFEETIKAVTEAQFNSAFTFQYSKRSGTPAAERKDVPDKKIVAERFDRLIDVMYPIMQTLNEKLIGKTVAVMIDDFVSNNQYKGKTDDGTLVNFSSEQRYKQGDVVFVTIETARSFYVTGRA